MSELFAPVVSITLTRRRRFLWAAWWTAPPARAPFRGPDASRGGTRTRAEALRDAEAAAGRPLVEIEARWARAWARVLIGAPAWTRRDERDAGEGDAARPAVRAAREAPAGSIWAVLGVPSTAALDEIKRAFRARALAAHPDQGGAADTFRALRRAYDAAVARRERAARRPRGR